MELDHHGQPARAINWHRNLLKSVESLLGLCRGLIADNQLNDAEIAFLDSWLQDNHEVTQAWPGDTISRRVREILDDGIVSQAEADDLKETLSQITGGFLQHGAVSGTSTLLPVEPVSSISFQNSLFCFTGKFIFGTRSRCENATILLGGICAADVTQQLNYLVIGGLASRDWANTSFGRKIEKAVKLRENGNPLRIISEESWKNFI